jgi:hypothetical protein
MMSLWSRLGWNFVSVSPDMFDCLFGLYVFLCDITCQQESTSIVYLV